MFNFGNKNKGFTLIELIVTIFVILIGVLGAYSVIQQILSYTSFVNSKLTAAYLAQEGVEIVKNIRDTNWLEREGWNNGLAEGDWRADYNDLDLLPYGGNFLNFETASGFYGYDSGNPTKFKRKITIDPNIDPNGNDILEVTILVEWTEKGKTHQITVREDLYNWQ